jgi:GntR family transcriptional regulator
MRSRVDLPQPDGPTRTRNSPLPIVSETASTATTPPEKILLTLSRTISATRTIVESIPHPSNESNGIDHFRGCLYSRDHVDATGAPTKITKQSAARQQVLELIERLGVGTAIPSERQLSADLGVSRLTVRAALDDLAREGYLVRRRGSGTYVQQPKISQQLTMTSFSEDMRRRGMAPSSTTLSLTRQLAGPRLGRFLNVSPGDDVVVVKRLRLADGVSMAIETLHIPANVVPGVQPRDLEGSFYELLRNRYGIEIATAVQTIEPTVTNEEESAVLDVPLHSPAFLFERTSRDADGRTLEFVHSIYRGDRYQIVSELTPS